MRRREFLKLSVLGLLAQGQSQAAIALVGTPAQASDVTGLPVTSFATGSFSATTGNLLVAVVSWFNPVTPPTDAPITDNAGNTWTFIVEAHPDVNSRISMYYAKNITGNASLQVTATFTGTALYPILEVLQYSGCDTTSPYDGNGVGSTVPSASSLTSGTFTTSIANEVIVFGCRNGGGTGLTYTAGTNYTKQIQDTNGVMATQDRIVSSIQTSQTTSMSCSATAAWLGVLASFKMSAASANIRSIPIIQ